MSEKAKKIILDHDLGSDCDDAGAIAILMKGHLQGRCRALAVTHTIADHYGQYAACAIAGYYGVTDVPFGINLENDRLSGEEYRASSKYAAEKYFAGRGLPELEGNVGLLRRVLAANGRKDISLVTIGPLTTVCGLLRSGPDGVSPKTGRELFRENVSEFICGGCNFVDSAVSDWNIAADPDASDEVVNRALMPMTFVGDEVGGRIVTGSYLEACDPGYPVRDCYLSFNKGKGFTRYSWDLATVYYAIMGGCGLWEKKNGLGVRVNGAGNTFFSPGGEHACLVQTAGDAEVTETLDRAMMYGM